MPDNWFFEESWQAFNRSEERMTSPLISAARALAKSQCGCECFDKLEPEAQASLIEDVRAVMESLVANASEGMLRAGGVAGNWLPDFDKREREAEAAAVLQAMIDKALSE